MPPLSSPQKVAMPTQATIPTGTLSQGDTWARPPSGPNDRSKIAANTEARA